MSDRTIRAVSWNIAKRDDPWSELAKMADRGEADLALLQEAGDPPGEIAGRFHYENDPLEPTSFDRWPLVVKLSDKVEVEWFRQVPAMGRWRDEREIEVSGIGTMAVARVVPCGQAEEAFLAVSMYARWTRAHPSTTGKRPGRHADLSVHRILSDLQTFMDYLDPSRYRMLAAGDLNLSYGATEGPWYERERVVWDRFKALGLEFLGPQRPNGRAPASTPPDSPENTQDVPTYHTRRQSPAEANRQLDYAFASSGLHENVTVRLLNGVEEWGPSDHCRLLIEVGGT
ncbi:MAG: endonuclease/exonuclease/phosphatase family protein [Chloroflexi bacterium]|nr:endonuclease/exonuclease/phosphatase family protein [Chloroflexota bacterium]